MDVFFPRYKNVFFLITLLLLQTLGLAVQVRRPVEAGERDSAQVTLARAWVVGAVAPIERAAWRTHDAIHGLWTDYIDLRGARRENRALAGQIAQMRLEQAAIAEDAVQGHRLQALLAFQQHYVAATVAAQVIGTSGSELSRVVYLDKGAADGLKPDMAVITPDGIVGKVRDVFPRTSPHTAQVLLINDQTSGAGVILRDTRLRAVIRGTTAGEVQIGNLTADPRIKPGEVVLTSGGDQVFPRGLPVGTVESVAPDPEHSPYAAIRVRPAANLFQVEEVLVITGTAADLPKPTMDALARGAAMTATARAAAEKAAEAARMAAALAEQERRDELARTAAEAAADRLPSLRDTADAEARAKEDALHPRTAGGTVPRPTPTIRPDRYSPGTSPNVSPPRSGAAGAAGGTALRTKRVSPEAGGAVPAPKAPGTGSGAATPPPRQR